MRILPPHPINSSVMSLHFPFFSSSCFLFCTVGAEGVLGQGHDCTLSSFGAAFSGQRARERAAWHCFGHCADRCVMRCVSPTELVLSV